VRYLRVFYALVCTMWTMYLIQVVTAAHLSHPEGTLRGAVNCVLGLAVLPSVAGYLLLFKTFPWMGRLIWR